MKKKDLALKVMDLVGKEENVSSLTHCSTRLRFVLKDESKAKIEELSALEGVLTAQSKGGQVQIVIGASVDLVYAEIVEHTNVKVLGAHADESSGERKGKHKNPINVFIETIAGIFTPILPALIGCGFVQCLARILTTTGVVDSKSGFVSILNMIGVSVFYFLPFFLAVSSARKFKTNEFMAICLAAAYMHPTIMSAAEPIRFLGLPIKNMNYSSTVIPIILSVFIMKFVYNFINKYMPEVVKILLVPMLTLFIMIPLQLVVLGPIGAYIGTGLSGIITILFNLNSAIAGMILGFFRPILVMFGMHYSIMPMQIQQIAELGYTVLLPSALCANLAQSGAAFGVMLRTKNKAMKTAAASASFTAAFGITEPAIYGVTLRYKKPFFCACAAAAIASGFLGIVNGRGTVVAPPGLLSMGSYEANKYIFIIIAVVLSFILSAGLTCVLGIDEKKYNMEE